MKYVLALVALGLACSEASAISRYQTMRMGCGEVKSVLRQEGAAILRWNSTRNPSLPLYGRYVSNARFCEAGEITQSSAVPTRDTRTCYVNRCVMPDRDIRKRPWIIPN